MDKNASLPSPETWNALAVDFDGMADSNKPDDLIAQGTLMQLIKQAARLFQASADSGAFPLGWPDGLDVTDIQTPHVQRFLKLGGSCIAEGFGKTELVHVPGTNQMVTLPTEYVIWRLGVVPWLIENFPDEFDGGAWNILAVPGKEPVKLPAAVLPCEDLAMLARHDARACRLLARILPDPNDLKKHNLKQPKPIAIECYRLHVLRGIPQAEIAKMLSSEHKRKVNQGQVSRWIKTVREWLEAGNVLPPMKAGEGRKRAKSVDPRKLDYQGKPDGRVRARKSPQQYDGDE